MLSVQVLRSCGHRQLDEQAVEAVRRAGSGRGPLSEPGPVVTRWRVEASVAVAPPTAIGFAFDETGHLEPGARGVKKYLGMGTYPLKETLEKRVALLSIENRPAAAPR